MSAAAQIATAAVLVPLATAAATAMARARPALQAALSTLGILAFLGLAAALVALSGQGPATVAFGEWALPFGIGFEVDRTGAALILITALMGAASLLFLSSDADTGGSHAPMLLPLLHGLLAGVAGAFATADLFNLYVWFEVMLICSVGLLAIGGRTDQLDGTFRYLSLNLFGTMLVLMAVGWVYATTGHLNFAALGPATEPHGLLGSAVVGVLLLAFLIKAGAFPLFAWLPAAYHTLPAPVLALFAGLLTKVGVYAVLRTTADIFETPAALSEILGWVAAATMLIGVLGAAYHWDMRRILAFHIVSQIGYILLAIALATQAAHAATLFYTVHHIIVKANLFLIAAMVWRLTGSYDLRRIGGLYKSRPGLGLLFLVPALSLVGIPPLSGFWAKLLVLQEALAQGRWAWTAIALAVSVLTMYSMVKIWMEAFWKAHPEPQRLQQVGQPRLAAAWAATLGLAGLTLLIGLNPQALLGFSLEAAASMNAR